MKREAITWETLDWEALDRLRQAFLSGQPSAGNYWTAWNDLASYDLTFAQRIGWKWDAVIAELKLRHWSPPPSGVLLDWGCGSGIASRCVLDGFGSGSFARLDVFDRSSMAMEFARAKATEKYPSLPVTSGATDAMQDAPGSSPVTLVISHVLNELDEAGGQSLRTVMDRADVVLWVEPGTYADSRSLIAMREALRDRFILIAPCTHQKACGLLTPDNERHWCHHFASPPVNLMADAHWMQFARRAGVDLRSIPYSFLVLERRGLRESPPGLLDPGWSRTLGRTRLYKGYAKVQSCQESGVCDLQLQKRDCPAVFKAFDRADADPVYRWTTEGVWIRDAEKLPG
ncbi:MAG TPA: small ribosomal subunit Rsm22 family protein [Verrucomicrobiae bacterium]|nr:small ribosomal subunit Rsm22 family protein [Verrucomicrobiae bacterium]